MWILFLNIIFIFQEILYLLAIEVRTDNIAKLMILILGWQQILQVESICISFFNPTATSILKWLTPPWQLYLRQPDATVPTPLVRLAAFQRVHILSGKSQTVNLSILPETHAVVLNGDASGDAIYAAPVNQTVQAGRLELFAGGGQPSYYEGSVSATVNVIDTAPLHQCEEAPSAYAMYV